MGHALPQRPQLRGSLRVSVQLAPQRVCPPEQIGAQAPAVQSSPTAHALLQRPQWVFELVMSTHDDPHIMRGAVHIEIGVQTPAAQVSLAPHAVPHAPQLRASLWMSTQVVPQRRWKPVHTGTQAPAVHVSVAAHTRPHEPQFCSSVCVSTQASRQMLCPLAQRQVPAVQVAPVGQVVPQAPQFAASVRGSTHALPHINRGAAQVVTVMQTPAEQA